MNIALIVDSLNLSESGGVGTCVYDLCAGFCETRAVSNFYLIGVINSRQDDILLADLQKKGINIFCLGAKNRKDALIHFLRYSLKLRKFISNISRDEYTACNLHLKLGVLFGTVSTIGIYNVKRCETYHNTYHRYWLQCTILRPFIKRYICVSYAARKEMKERFHISDDKLIAIPNGVNRDELRKKVNIVEAESNAIPIVLTVGRLSYEKNILTSAVAIAEMKDKNFQYIIIGDGPERDELNDIVSNVDNIVYKGAVSRDQVLEYLSNSDLVLIPSLWEGRSIFMLEAAAFDKPFILSDCPGLREPFNEHALEQDEQMRVCKFGYLVKTNSKEAYQNAIRHYIEHKEMHKMFSSYVSNISRKNDVKCVISQYINVMTDME